MEEPSVDLRVEYEVQLDALVEKLSASPEHDSVAQEIGVLRSIYAGDNGEFVRVCTDHPDGSPDECLARYEVLMNLQSPHDVSGTRFRVLVSIPNDYPSSTSPRLQVLSKYIGSFAVDSELVESVFRAFVDGVEWLGDVCVFDALEYVRERVTKWYIDKLSEATGKEILRQDDEEKEERNPSHLVHVQMNPSSSPSSGISVEPKPLPVDLELAISEPIVDRKSIFVGRACKISHPDQVASVLACLMSDRRIARAAHPIINAWRCRMGNVLHQDNDDDGETAAGGRLAHLLQLLEIEDVLVVVTRYFGGIHLGPDRFKHINQAARNALEAGGFLKKLESEKSAKSKKKGKGS